MDTTTLLYSFILLIGVFIGSVSQILLKKAALKSYDSIVKEYLNIRVILAYTLFVGTTLISIIAYKGIPLSLGPVLEATSYIYVSIFGVAIFGEKLSAKKVVALFLIIAGVLVYAIWG